MMNHARLASSGKSERKWRTISATSVVASTLGVLAGVLGIEHGSFETRQGNVAPSSLVISALGPPRETDRAWHGCEPALTIVTSFLVSGLLAIIVSCIILIWAAAFVQGRHGPLVLILLSVVQLLVGGGLTSPFFGVIAGLAGTKIYAPLTWWRVHLSTGTRRLLVMWWPWSLIAITAGIAILACAVAIALAPAAPGWWRALAIVGAALGIAGFAVFWDGQPQLLAQEGAIGAVISLILLVSAIAISGPFS